MLESKEIVCLRMLWFEVIWESVPVISSLSDWKRIPNLIQIDIDDGSSGRVHGSRDPQTVSDSH